MKRWTNSGLDGIDDVGFAIIILAERQAKLNQSSPLALKLQKARNALEAMRAGPGPARPKTNFESFKDSLGVGDFVDAKGTRMKWTCVKCPADISCRRLIEKKGGDVPGCAERFRTWAASATTWATTRAE